MPTDSTGETRVAGGLAGRSGGFGAAGRATGGAVLGLLEAIGVALDLDDLGAVAEAVDEGDDAGGVGEDGWAQGGLRFVRFGFEHHPTVLRSHPDRRDTNLDALGRRREGTPLVVFARATRLREYDDGHAWLRQLGPWPLRAIVDLDPRADDDPALLEEEREARRVLARAGLRRFPFTSAGLVAMAQYVGSGGAMQVAAADESLRPAREIADVLDAWASCLACVPDASWAQLEVFRREFFAAALPDPRYVQARASAVLLQQLRGAEPRAEGDRRLRDFKVAVHEAVLAERDAQRGDVGADLQVFIGDAMEEDLRRWVADEVTRRGDDIPPWLIQLQTAMMRKDL